MPYLHGAYIFKQFTVENELLLDSFSPAVGIDRDGSIAKPPWGAMG